MGAFMAEETEDKLAQNTQQQKETVRSSSGPSSRVVRSPRSQQPAIWRDQDRTRGGKAVAWSPPGQRGPTPGGGAHPRRRDPQCQGARGAGVSRARGRVRTDPPSCSRSTGIVENLQHGSKQGHTPAHGIEGCGGVAGRVLPRTAPTEAHGQAPPPTVRPRAAPKA